IDALRQVAAPGAERVDPALHGVEVPAEPIHGERGAPAVVAYRLHLDGVPAARAGAAPEQSRADQVVAVREDIGLHDHALAGDPLDGEPATVDLGPYVFNDRALPTVRRDAADPLLLLDRPCHQAGVSVPSVLVQG